MIRTPKSGHESVHFLGYGSLIAGFFIEQDTGIEPAHQPWEGRVLPLY